MRICIDARRVDESGIGRATTNLLLGLSTCELNHEFILIVDDNCPPTIPFNEKNCEVIRLAGHPFSRAGIHLVPRIIKTALSDLFIAPHSYSSPFIECSSIEFIHDLWPIVRPEWTPTRNQLEAKYGKAAVLEMTRISAYFKARVESGTMLPQNRFVNQDLILEKLDSPRLFAIAMLTFAIARASRVIVPSQYVRDEVGTYFPEVLHKVLVIPQFVAPTLLSSVAISKSDTILNVCKWSPRKNIETVIRAVDRLRCHYPDTYDYKLLLVGNVNPSTYSTRILEMVQRRRQYVICPGVLNDQHLSMLYRAAKVVLLLSFYEGFGIPAIEAMASGTPVIASDIRPFREVCGTAAVYVNPTDIDEISDAIHDLLINTNKYHELVETGRAQASLFRVDSIMHNLLSVVQDVALETHAGCRT